MKLLLLLAVLTTTALPKPFFWSYFGFGGKTDASTRVLLTGGEDESDHFSSSEVYPGGCSPPPLPGPRAAHVTFTTVGSSPVVATCGGQDDGGSLLSSCLVLQGGEWRTGVMSDLPESRLYAATASTAAGTFLLGGLSSSQASTSAFLAADSIAWEEGPALPQDMRNPCAAQISPTSFLLLHGKTILEFDSSVAGPTSEAGWRPAGTWPDLLTDRKLWPGCAVVGHTLYIAGGWDGSTLRTTETLDLDTRTISPGPSMASPRRSFHLVTLPGPRLIAIGGRDDDWNSLASVEELEEGAWVEAAALEGGRKTYGAVAMPEGLVCT